MKKILLLAASALMLFACSKEDSAPAPQGGGFEPVPYSGFATGNPPEHIYTVYPYNERTALESVSVDHCQLQSLNVSGLSHLKKLYCHYNPDITSIDFSGLTAIEDLRFNGTGLTASSPKTYLKYKEGSQYLTQDPNTAYSDWGTEIRVTP